VTGTLLHQLLFNRSRYYDNLIARRGQQLHTDFLVKPNGRIISSKIINTEFLNLRLGLLVGHVNDNVTAARFS